MNNGPVLEDVLVPPSFGGVPGARFVPESRLGGHGDGDGPTERPGTADRTRLGDSQRCVMVVEDEADAREAMVELIEGEGFAAVGAVLGQEALDILKSGTRPSLILLDLKMPVMDGWGFCEAL